MGRPLIATAAWILLLPALTLAQSEEALQQRFVGTPVIAKMGLPNTEQGLNIFVGRSPEVNSSEYAKRLALYGRGLIAGEWTTITRIRVRPSSIEVHLGNGGKAGVPPSRMPDLPDVQRLSAAEENAITTLNSSRDPAARTQARRDLEAARREREQKEALERLTAGAPPNPGTLASSSQWGSGSRLILRFSGAVPPNTLTPDGLQAVLAPYVAFEPPPAESGPAPAVAEAPRRVKVHTGMSQREVDILLGIRECLLEKEKGKQALRCTYFHEKNRVLALFQEGILVEFRVLPR